MTQEQKELLLKDLCARLPYGVKVESVFINPDTKEHKSCGIEVFDATSILMIRDGLGEFKPYLFPFSSMTEEQAEELKNIYYSYNGMFHYTERIFDRIPFSKMKYFPYQIEEFFNKNHIDYRGLIEKGLAIDATNKNIY